MHSIPQSTCTRARHALAEQVDVTFQVPFVQAADAEPAKPLEQVPLQLPPDAVVLQLDGQSALPPVGSVVQLSVVTAARKQQASNADSRGPAQQSVNGRACLRLRWCTALNTATEHMHARSPRTR